MWPNEQASLFKGIHGANAVASTSRFASLLNRRPSEAASSKSGAAFLVFGQRLNPEANALDGDQSSARNVPWFANNLAAHMTVAERFIQAASADAEHAADLRDRCPLNGRVVGAL